MLIDHDLEPLGEGIEFAITGEQTAKGASTPRSAGGLNARRGFAGVRALGLVRSGTSWCSLVQVLDVGQVLDAGEGFTPRIHGGPDLGVLDQLPGQR